MSCDDGDMAQEDFGSEMDYESWEGNHDAPNARRTLDAYEQELRVQRENQETYVGMLRSRAISVLTIVSGALLIVAAFADLTSISGWFVLAAATGVGVIVLSAVQVHRPRGGFYTGPQLQGQITSSQEQGHLDVMVRWRLAEWTAENITRNDKGPIARMQWWFLLELVAAAAVVLAVLLGMATV